LHHVFENNIGIVMPNYDYRCLECGYNFEEFQKMTDEPLTKCPKCKGHVKRLIGAGLGPIFKGSGFYQTDYKNKSSKPSSPVSSKSNKS
jgi:putative FmdB family regulatory protein